MRIVNFVDKFYSMLEKIFIYIYNFGLKLIQEIWDLILIVGEWLLKMNSSYDELILVLIGGELTLITLFFALIPTLVDKQNEQYYLGYKISDFFLYGNGKQNELIKTWICGIFLTLINILLCLLKLDNLSFVFFLFFITYFTIKIINYLKFISDKKDIKEKIEKVFSKDIKDNHDIVIQQLVETSKSKLSFAYSNMDFLFNNYENSTILNEYVNELLGVKEIDKDSLYLKLCEYIKNRKYNYIYRFDSSKLYKYIRNNIDDYNKEDYYGIIHSILVNNYNCYINNNQENIEVLVLPIFSGIDNSKLSPSNKNDLKNRIINNMNIYIKKDYNILDKEYIYSYKYKFEVLKNIIDKKDLTLFNKFIRNNQIGYDNCTSVYDLYLTCYIYLYYLIKVETEKYVSKDDKEFFKSLYEKLNNACSFSNFEIVDHYYKNFSVFFKNLDKITRWWEKFNLEDQYDVKTGLVDYSINKCKKALFIIFGKDCINNNYYITDEIINLFKYDFENGTLKNATKEEIKDVLSFFKFNITNEFEKFQETFLDFITTNYKIDELSKKINIEELSLKLNNELSLIKENISKLDIVNNKKCKHIEECYYNINCSKAFLDNFYANKNLLKELKLESGLESYIYECILNKIENKIFHTYRDDKIILDTLNKIKGKYYYFRPSKDLLGEEWKFGNKYITKIAKHNIVNTHISKTRLLIKNYNCSIDNISLELKEVSEKFIKMKLKEHFISRNKYCIKNEFGLDIFFTKREFIDYLKNTEVWLQIKTRFGLDVFGDNNIALIRK